MEEIWQSRKERTNSLADAAEVLGQIGTGVGLCFEFQAVGQRHLEIEVRRPAIEALTSAPVIEVVLLFGPMSRESEGQGTRVATAELPAQTALESGNARIGSRIDPGEQAVAGTDVAGDGPHQLHP